jgi:hypothetical protein
VVLAVTPLAAVTVVVVRTAMLSTSTEVTAATQELVATALRATVALAAREPRTDMTVPTAFRQAVRVTAAMAETVTTQTPTRTLRQEPRAVTAVTVELARARVAVETAETQVTVPTVRTVSTQR